MKRTTAIFALILAAAMLSTSAQAAWYWPFGDDEDSPDAPPRLHRLLENANVVGTPGEGFGACGQGYFRLTAFGDADRTKEAAQRIKAALAKL